MLLKVYGPCKAILDLCTCLIGYPGLRYPTVAPKPMEELVAPLEVFLTFIEGTLLEANIFALLRRFWSSPMGACERTRRVWPPRP